jgi:hypothetical protein
MMGDATEYRGTCHCGAIGFTYTTGLRPHRWSVRACQCSFCRAHDALSTSDPDGRLVFIADVPECLQRYRFGMGTADFLLCRNCGIYVGAAIESDNGRFGIINTHALIDPPARMATAVPISYDNENTEGRISRRGERWTPTADLP